MDYFKGIGKPERGISILLVFILLCSFQALSGCSPKIIEKVKTEYVYQDVHHRDTLITRDSIYIREWMKGDTIYIEKYKNRYVFRDRWRDSVSIREVHDTTTVEKKVERELTVGQKMKINSFWYLLAGFILSLLWIFRKYWLPILKIIK